MQRRRLKHNTETTSTAGNQATHARARPPPGHAVAWATEPASLPRKKKEAVPSGPTRICADIRLRIAYQDKPVSSLAARCTMQGGRAPWQPPSLRKKPRFSGARCSDTRKGSPALWGVPSTHQRLRTHLARRSLIRLLGARYAPLREKDSSHYRVTEGIGPICRGRLQTLPTQFHRERPPKAAREKTHARAPPLS